MKTLDQWFCEYKESHQNRINQLIHKICVPLITFSIIGILWSLPFPGEIQFSPYFNWGSVFVTACLAFYLILSFKMFLAMLLQTALMMWILETLIPKQYFLKLNLTIFVVSWILQFIGHKIEGRKPSLFNDLVFLLIGPVWVLDQFFNLFQTKNVP